MRPQYHTIWITVWNDSHNRVIEGIQFTRNGCLCDNTPYMQWYIEHIISYITPCNLPLTIM